MVLCNTLHFARCTQKEEEESLHLFQPTLGLIRCLVLHGRASGCAHSFQARINNTHSTILFTGLATGSLEQQGTAPMTCWALKLLPQDGGMIRKISSDIEHGAGGAK